MNDEMPLLGVAAMIVAAILMGMKMALTGAWAANSLFTGCGPIGTCIPQCVSGWSYIWWHGICPVNH